MSLPRFSQEPKVSRLTPFLPCHCHALDRILGWTPKMSNTPIEYGQITFERTEADENLVRLTGTLSDPCDALIVSVGSSVLSCTV
jgi:hypothetical protein